MKPSHKARPEYIAAFSEIAMRIANVLPHGDHRREPVRMYVAGGAAMYLYTGARISEDVDAVFSVRVALPHDLEVAYRDADGTAKLLYFDYQYNDTFGLLHEDAHTDSIPLELEAVDVDVMEVRLLSPLDLAVSKIGRLADHDREDIATLARAGMIQTQPLRLRAEDALIGYVGDLQRLRNSIDIACRIVDGVAPKSTVAVKRRPRKA